MDGFMTTKEAASKWNISVRQVQYYCKKGTIKDAVKVGTNWLIPNGHSVHNILLYVSAHRVKKNDNNYLTISMGWRWR